MHIEPTCTGLSQVAINGIKYLGPFANDERDSFIRCRTIEKMMGTSKQDFLEVNVWPQSMEERLTTIVQDKVDNAVKTTFYKVEKSYADAIAVNPKAAKADLSRAKNELKTQDHDNRKNF